jgi:hypothetical protein
LHESSSATQLVSSAVQVDPIQILSLASCVDDECAISFEDHMRVIKRMAREACQMNQSPMRPSWCAGYEISEPECLGFNPDAVQSLIYSHKVDTPFGACRLEDVRHSLEATIGSTSLANFWEASVSTWNR